MAKNILIAIAGILFLFSTIIIYANTKEHVNEIFERVLRQILKIKMQNEKQEMTQMNTSDEMEISLTILSNLLWEIEEKIVEKMILEKKWPLNGETADFIEILQENEFLGKNDNLLKTLKNYLFAKLKIKKTISAEDNVKILNLFLSFAIRLGYHVGSNKLNEHRPNFEKIKLEKFVKAYNWVEKEFTASKNSVSILRISFSNHKNLAIIKFNQQQDKESANYKIHNFETIRWLLDWKEANNSLKYWVEMLEFISDRKHKIKIVGKSPMNRLMITWTGRIDIGQPGKDWCNIILNTHEQCALSYFGMNMAKRIIREYFPEEEGVINYAGELTQNYNNNWPKLWKTYKLWGEIEAGMHYEDAILINERNEEQLNEIFERVLRQILIGKMPKNDQDIGGKKLSNKIEMPATLLSNLLWEIEEKIVEKTILKNNCLLSVETVDFFKILEENKFIAKNDNLLKKMKKEEALAKISTRESVKMLNLFLSFSIRLGYHLGLKKLNEHRLEREVIKLEKFVKAYICVENKFPVSKNSVSTLPISILNDNSLYEKYYQRKINHEKLAVPEALTSATARITFNQQPDKETANYKIYNFETIRWLLDSNEHSLEYWVNKLIWMTKSKYMEFGFGQEISPLDRLMITWIGSTSKARFNFDDNLHAQRALINFGVNVAKKVGENFPKKRDKIKSLTVDMIEIFVNKSRQDFQMELWKETEAGMHYEDAIFIQGMQNDYNQIESKKNFNDESSSEE